MDSNQLEELGLVKVCRTCLTEEGTMINVFEDTEKDDSLRKRLEIITSSDISQSDGLPVTICTKCESRLNDAYDFRTQCVKSSTTLRKYIENALNPNLKEEKLHEDYDIKDEYETILAETNLQDDSEVSDVEDDDEDDDNDDEADDDNDETPLNQRKDDKKRKIIEQFDAEIVNEAIIASKQKFNETRECRICGFISTNRRGLSLHIGHLHKELKDRWCSVCYQEVENLTEHMKIHSKVKNYLCMFCGKGFSSQGHLTEHIRSHSNHRPFKCKECHKGFLSKRQLRVHERIHSGEKPYTCPHCFRSFTQNGSLQTHIRTHGDHQYGCDICKNSNTLTSKFLKRRSGKTKTRLENDDDTVEIEYQEVRDGNVKVENEKSDKNAHEVVNLELEDDADKNNKKLCTVCGKTFTTTSKLRLHMRVHTGETPYKCSYCDKRFSTRGQMVVHIRTHTGEKPHVCHICGKGFAQSSVLNTHMRLHTGRPEVCHVCQQRFCRPAELRLHMRKHTGEKPYLCNQCGHSFIQRSHLMEHVKTHSDERPYQCNYCEKAFKQSSSLKSHIQIHTGQKPYQCSQCQYACRQSYALTQHMKQHQDRDPPRPEKPHECLVCHRSFTTIAMLNSHSRAIHNGVF